MGWEQHVENAWKAIWAQIPERTQHYFLAWEVWCNKWYIIASLPLDFKTGTPSIYYFGRFSMAFMIMIEGMLLWENRFNSFHVACFVAYIAGMLILLKEPTRWRTVLWIGVYTLLIATLTYLF